MTAVCPQCDGAGNVVIQPTGRKVSFVKRCPTCDGSGWVNYHRAADEAAA